MIRTTDREMGATDQVIHLSDRERVQNWRIIGHATEREMHTTDRVTHTTDRVTHTTDRVTLITDQVPHTTDRVIRTTDEKCTQLTHTQPTE